MRSSQVDKAGLLENKRGNIMIKILPFLALFFMCSCNVSTADSGKVNQGSIVLSVDQVRGNPEYISKIVDIRGEVIVEYHGTALCGQEETLCFFIDPVSELEEDYLYEIYDKLAGEIGLVQKKLGKAKLFATLRGRPEYYIYSDDGEEEIIKSFEEDDDRLIRVRFVLHKVLELDIRSGSGKPDPFYSDDPADWEEILKEKASTSVQRQFVLF